MWYLRRGVVLTKDNLARRNWPGSKKCCFCTHDETIKHLFFQCKFARSTWSVIQIASNLYPPTSVANIFGHWLDGISNRFKTLIRVGAYALIWSLWLCRNDLVFNDKKCFSSIGYFPVYALATYVVYATTSGGPTVVQGGVYAVGAGGYRGFYPTWVAA